eukprot:scaffold201334_cov31-Tisochrysis_lutea.AAC.1
MTRPNHGCTLNKATSKRVSLPTHPTRAHEEARTTDVHRMKALRWLTLVNCRRGGSQVFGDNVFVASSNSNDET